jgi:hypothetical protein
MNLTIEFDSFYSFLYRFRKVFTEYFKKCNAKFLQSQEEDCILQ